MEGRCAPPAPSLEIQTGPSDIAKQDRLLKYLMHLHLLKDPIISCN